MRPSYNQIAGTSVERLAALSDGAFSIAMTLLVLDLRAPAVEAIKSEGDLWRGLSALLPRLLVYVMSFLTLGIFWLGQQTQLNHLARSSRGLSWIHIAFLFAVSLTPFSTQLLAQFLSYRVALLVYWFNIFLLGLTLFLSWKFAVASNLIKPDISEHVHVAIERRILRAQTLYAVGAALCLVSTSVSIAVMVLLQLHYAVAPRWPWARANQERP